MIEVLSLFADCTSNASLQTNCLPHVAADSSALKTLLQIVFGILAALAVLMVTIGGMRYVMSEGNPDSTKQARGTILFALIGLAVALSAEGLVAFLLGGVN